MIIVLNKMFKISFLLLFHISIPEDTDDSNAIYISATEGTGLDRLLEATEDQLLENTDSSVSLIRVPNGGEEYRCVIIICKILRAGIISGRIYNLFFRLNLKIIARKKYIRMNPTNYNFFPAVLFFFSYYCSIFQFKMLETRKINNVINYPN